MRVTRAAQRAQQDVEEPIEEPIKAPEVDERILKDIEPNVSQAEEALLTKTPAKTPAKKGKGRGAKKGAKGRKAKIEEEEEEERAQFVEEAERQAAASPENEEADRDLHLENKDETAPVPDTEDQPKAAQTPAARLTRRQLAKLEEEALSKSQRATSLPPPQEAAVTDAMEMSAEQAPEEPVIKSRQKTVAENDEVRTVHEEPTNIGSEPAQKPVRLTRRQQAKLEEELKQSQAEQPSAKPEPTKGETLEDVVKEAQAEAVVEHEEVLEEPAIEEAIDVGEHVVPVATPNEQPGSPQKVAAEPQADKETETEMPEESQAPDSPTLEAAKIENSSETLEAAPATPTEAQFEKKVDTLDNPHPDEGAPALEISLEAEPKMLATERPFEGSVSTPARSSASHRRTSRSPSKSPMRLEESISAIDRLEEDLEDIGKAIPDFDHTDDEKLFRKPKSGQATATPLARAKTPGKTTAKTLARAQEKTATQTSAKTASGPPSKALAKAPIIAKAPVAAKAPVPTRISRVPSVAPKSVKPPITSLARANSVRTTASKDVRKPSTETADYLASKRRPISLSFPTPPPPPKGRAPTKPTFQLSSESVAAKLKAQKDERLKREAEGVAAPKQRPISMPPPPKSTKAPTVPSFQLPGEATAARLKAQKEERLRRMEEAGGAEKRTARPISMPPPPKSTKPPTKPSFQLPGEATAARLKAQKEERLKRMEEAEAAKKAAAAAAAPVRRPMAHRPRESLLVQDAPGVSIAPPPTSHSAVPQRSISLASKRSSTTGPSASRSPSTSSANRNSLLLTAGTKSTVTPVDAAALKAKGKHVFDRDRVEKEAAERERKDKEEAAKRARAEAAERGRIASREWAERQRRKMLTTGQ